VGAGVEIGQTGDGGGPFLGVEASARDGAGAVDDVLAKVADSGQVPQGRGLVGADGGEPEAVG
jgi:hypothetical protein